MCAHSIAGSGHPGWNLSRSCIHDTLFAKRTGVFRQKNTLLSALCATNIRSLRETQLAPHVETKMTANRYKVRQTIRKSSFMNCDCCQARSDFSGYVLRADNSFVQVLCANHMALCDKCLEEILQEVMVSSNDTIIVYMEDGLVHWLSLPAGNAQSFAMADQDVLDGGDDEECRYFFANFLMAHKPGMRFI